MNIITPSLQYGTSTATSVGTESKTSTETNSAPTKTGAGSSGTVNRDELDSAVASMQDYAQSVKRNLDFHIDDSTGRVVVQVIASDSGELIRQIPSEEALELAASLDDVRSLLVREQA